MAIPPEDRWVPFQFRHLERLVDSLDLSATEERVLIRLVGLVDPIDPRFDCTQTALAEYLRVSRDALRAALARLFEFGLIDYDFAQHRRGWVHVRCYDDLVFLSRWVAERRIEKARSRQLIGDFSPVADEKSPTVQHEWPDSSASEEGTLPTDWSRAGGEALSDEEWDYCVRCRDALGPSDCCEVVEGSLICCDCLPKAS